jgi:hypothetical protein
MTAPTPDELRAAWQAMSQRRSLRHWPATFEEVMADHLRARLVSIEATAARRKPATCAPVFIGIDRATGPDQTAYWRPCAKAPARFDHKRAAAGDTEPTDD